MHQFPAVKCDEQETNQKRSGDIDKKGAERVTVAKAAACAEADQIANERAGGATGRYKQTPFEQVPILTHVCP